MFPTNVKPKWTSFWRETHEFKSNASCRCGALHVGDILLAVSGEPVSRLTVDAVNRLIREQPGSSLRLEVLPGAVARSRGSVRYRKTDQLIIVFCCF